MIIETRILGKKKPLLGDFSVPPPVDLTDGDSLRLRDLIAHIVQHEVSQFTERQQDRRFDRVLSARQIDEASATGKIDPAARNVEQKVDADEAIATALQAFEDGMYLVIIDGVERRDLDEPVYLREDSRLVFLRLTFLAGA